MSREPTTMRPAPPGNHCPECLHPYNTVTPNQLTGSRHYQGCSRVDSAHGSGLNHKAKARVQQRLRHDQETRRAGVEVSAPARPRPAPAGAEFIHWNHCSIPDCQRCIGFEEAMDRGD